jgi:hypothetical protein
MKAYASLCEREEEKEQASALPAKELFRRMSQQEREAFARNGSLPDWFSTDLEPTPSGNSGGEAEVKAEAIQQGSEPEIAEESQHSEVVPVAEGSREGERESTPAPCQEGEKAPQPAEGNCLQ